ncbi:hypothetical protein NDU88_004885 [Pleurodeles waltl]|uniref:Uncharacterized protein n=1 Tax=Pleurodeles waltl TaxID=8319 RepID=A0AAV7SK79_PLEWA|nr:hypothetical protein NDU88_004885 [Pleurodeles waltl]
MGASVNVFLRCWKAFSASASQRKLTPCDGPLLRRANLLCREEIATASSNPEEQEATSNPFSLLGVEGQEQSVRALLRCKREDPGMDGGGRESGEEKETRSVTGGD